MLKLRADLDWYHSESEKISGSPLRCPFASPDRCPRFFESIALSESLGACAMDEAQLARLDARWKDDTIISAIPETAPSVISSNGRLSILSNFCPEVTFNIKGSCASLLSTFPDEIDQEARHRHLRRTGVDDLDPRWQWMDVIPMHYRACPTYSLLQPIAKAAVKADIVEFKPGAFGFKIDGNEILRRLKLWYRVR
jgi:hypothetical protein